MAMPQAVGMSCYRYTPSCAILLCWCIASLVVTTMIVRDYKGGQRNESTLKRQNASRWSR